MQSHQAPKARHRRVPPAARPPAGVLAFIGAGGPRPDAGQPGVVALEPGRCALGQIAERLTLTPGVRAVVLMADEIDEASPGRVAALRRIGQVLGPQGAMLLHGAAAEDAETIAEMARLARVRVVGLPALPMGGWSG